MWITLNLVTGSQIRFQVQHIVNFARYRGDNFTTIYTVDSKRWTVEETPEEIELMIAGGKI